MDAISAYARGDRDDSDLSSGESDEGSLDGLSQAMNLSNRGQTDRRGATTTSRTSCMFIFDLFQLTCFLFNS